MRIKLLILLACGGLLACSDRAAVEESADAAGASAIEQLADEYLRQMLLRYPETETYYSLANAPHDDLFDNSPEARQGWDAQVDAWLDALGQIEKPADIGSRDWVTYGILSEELLASKATRICRSETWAASTATAWHTSLPSVFELQPVGTPEARAAALRRLEKVAAYVDGEIRNLRSGLDFGYTAPRPTVEAVPREVRELLADDNPFLAMASRDGDGAFSANVQAIFDKDIAPAIERFAVYIEEDYLPNARESLAVADNPDGAACYRALVRSFTTIAPAADAIHETGLEQIAAIRSDMQAIIDEHFGGGSIEDFMRRLNNDPEFTFSSSDEILAHARASLQGVRELMPTLFSLVPKADVIIKPYPPHRSSGTGEYWSSSEDGERPGIFYLPVTEPEKRSRAGQQSFLFHETYPGHHLQGAIALELGDRVHPLARYLWNSGYAEGWGLYSERLMDEVGQYTTPLDRMGMLSDQGARAARLVIDTGLHTMGWTRQQAVDYMLANTAWSPVDIESEIDRYIAWPGQANAYMLGMLKIMELRDVAEQVFADDFDIREFHARVLENGSITLPMLEEVVVAWIEAYLAEAGPND